MNVRQKLFLTAVVIANGLLIGFSSNISDLVAHDRPVILGRYSRTHFGWIVGVLIISIIGLYVDQARTPQVYRKRWFRVIASMIVLTPTLLLADFALRQVVTPMYIYDDLAFHRPPDRSWTYEFHDLPASGWATHAPEGYSPISCTLDSDARGYRNSAPKASYDIVTLGDSFTEGSNVSNDEVWTTLFAERTDKSLYNLGMTGYGPVHYLASLEQHGLSLATEHVICMIYEGNDFRTAERELGPENPSLWERVSVYADRSPIRLMLDRLIQGTLASTQVEPDPKLVEMFSWLPLMVPEGPQSNPYAFGPKALFEHSQSADLFEMDPTWARACGYLDRIKSVCDDTNLKLTIAFAPTKAHVVLPLVRGRLPIEKLQEIAGLRTEWVPAADVFEKQLFDNLDARESVVRAWCASNDVPFISTTTVLRDAVANGTHAYFTYDHHWTPEGHRVVADHVAVNFVAEEETSSASDTGEMDAHDAAAITGQQ